MGKIKKSKAEKFMTRSLQLLALQFPDIKIKYGYQTTSESMHLVELISDTNPNINKPLVHARYAIESAFIERFIGKGSLLFTSAYNRISFKVDKPISTWNIKIDEMKRLSDKLRISYIDAGHPLNYVSPEESTAA